MFLVQMFPCLALVVSLSATFAGAFTTQVPKNRQMHGWGKSLDARQISLSSVATDDPSQVFEQQLAAEDLLDGSLTPDQANVQGNIDDDDDDKAAMLKKFVARLDATPRGELSNDELGLIKNVMIELCTMPGLEAAQMAEKMLFRMVGEWKNAKKNGNEEIATKLEPQSRDFQMVMTAYEQSGSRDAYKHVGFLFFEQEEIYENGVATVKPTLDNIRTALRILAASKDKGADRRAYAIYESMRGYGLKPDGEAYSATIIALAKSRQRGAAGRAESLLQEAVELCAPYKDEEGVSRGISVAAFNAVITAWAKSESEDGPQKAKELIVLMDEINQENGGDVLKANVQSFTSLIDAYAQTNEWWGACECEGIFNRILDQFLDGEEELEPNLATWTIVMSVYNRLSKKRERNAADRAEKLLRRLEDLYREGRTSYQPDRVAYNTVLNAWASSIADGAAQRAEEILNDMYELYLDGDDSMKPTTKSFQIVLDTWIKSNEPNSAEKAESLLRRMEDIHDDAGTDNEQIKDMYKSVLFGWSKGNEPLKAHEYLKLMVSEGMKPDSFCFDKVVESYTNKNEEYSMKETYQVFELLESCRKAGDVKPNERVFTSFIRAMTKAKVKGMAQKSQLVLNRMKSMYEEGNRGIAPTVFTYNAVLNACAQSVGEESGGKMDAFKIALSTFKDLKSEKEQPDHVTFGNMLRCAALLPEGEQRNAVATSTFKMCCESGFVNSYVLRDLQYSSPETLWRPLLSCPSGEARVEDLPEAWRNKFTNDKFNSNKPSNNKFNNRKKY